MSEAPFIQRTTPLLPLPPLRVLPEVIDELPALARPTPRQRLALELLAEGKTFPEVATVMYLSVEGVKSLVRRLRPLWGARNTTHMIAIAIRHGFI